MKKPTIGIIGGSGLYSMPGFTAHEEVILETPWGMPSDPYVVGQLAGKEVAFLSRHGRGHRHSPSELNFRANIYGFKTLGVERILSLSAVGSLKEEHAPLKFVIPDQFFDRTRGRVSTFFGEGLVAHISFADPVCPQLSEVVHQACLETGVGVARGGTYLCMEGPAFSTKAESNVYRSWGMDVIGMTNLAGGQARARGRALLRHHRDGDRLRLLARRARCRDGDRYSGEPEAECRQRLQSSGGHGGQHAGSARMQMRIGAGARVDHRSEGRARSDAQEAGAAGWKISRLSRSHKSCWSIAWRSAPWPEHLLDDLIARGGDRELFRIVVERLADLFEPGLCRVYAELFSQVIARRIPGLHADHLTARYERIRRPRVFDRDPESIQNIFVLSRVTLGADVAVTSVILDAAKQRFPNARIWFVGPAKSWELFAADPRLRHLPIAYGRGGTPSMTGCRCGRNCARRFALPHSIVIDPDSRLTQLGLLPICPEEDYYLFESRSYGRRGDEPLPDLARRWATKRSASRMPVRISQQVWMRRSSPRRSVSASAKIHRRRVPDPFEAEVLRRLPRPILIDKGAGGEEAERVERAVAKVGGNGIVMWDGSFAGFAAHIQRSKLYVGYDSAGGHAAAACGIPMISIFAGAVSERMFQRWRPAGAGKVEVSSSGQNDRARIAGYF